MNGGSLWRVALHHEFSCEAPLSMILHSDCEREQKRERRERSRWSAQHVEAYQEHSSACSSAGHHASATSE